MLRKARITLAVFFFVAITLLFLDFTGTIHAWFEWVAKVQFLPAVLALNFGVVIALVLLTLIFGRIYEALNRSGIHHRLHLLRGGYRRYQIRHNHGSCKIRGKRRGQLQHVAVAQVQVHVQRRIERNLHAPHSTTARSAFQARFQECRFVLQ